MEIRMKPDLKERNRLLSEIIFRVSQAGAGRHPLDVSGSYDRSVPHAVGMRHFAVKDNRDDFHFPMRVRRESGARHHNIVIENTQCAELDILGIVILRK